MRRTLPALLLALAPLAGRAADDLRITKTDTELEFHAGQDVVTNYRYAGTVPVGKGDATRPLAKPFFYPLFAPGGVPVTRGWPVDKGPGDGTTDHVHQKSVWFCHGDVFPEGVELGGKSGAAEKGVDFWSEGGRHGRIVCTRVGEPKIVSAGHLRIPTTNEWTTADGVKIMDEERTIHLLTLPAGRLLVLDVDLHASVCPVTFEDTKEGSMGVRVNDAIRADPKSKTGGTLANAAGKTGERDVWGFQADWCDYFGTIGDKVAGVAVFDDPGNKHRASWHARGYGLMAANPFGRQAAGFPSQKGKTDLVKLAKGEHLKLRYGVYAHAGDTAAGKVAEAYKTFAEMK
jgi:hypothetical protein